MPGGKGRSWQLHTTYACLWPSCCLPQQPTPKINSTGGPYIAPFPYPSTVNFNGTGAQCASPPCTYTVSA